MDDWIEHRRGDGELIGWMRPEGDGFVPIDLLGREAGSVSDWLTAEELLDEQGLQYLAEPFMLRLDDGNQLRVRIVEVSRDRILVKKDDFGDINAPRMDYVLPFPVPVELQASVRSR
ncbi:MAG TPA: hypothetical protein VGO99_09930 [Leifsonia sp.]|jgi:hypothetical protein|nr:hypothetical protein [Leifsonia sp.]